MTPAVSDRPSSRRILLLRRGLVFLEDEARTQGSSEALVRGLELQLAGLGYALSTRLSTRLRSLTPEQLGELQGWLWQTLALHLGADRPHEPLFRHFPEGIPTDTRALWWRKVLVHFLEAADQPCLFCRRVGTTHVLSPCRHVVCDHCFDGSNYSACPICERQIDRNTPFLRPSDVPREARPTEQVTFALLDLGEGLESTLVGFLRGLCERPQALSPTDRDDLLVLLAERGEKALAELPPVIPVKEIRAFVFATLCQLGDPGRVLAAARPHLRTATDVLRFLAVLSKADPSLQGQDVYRDRPAQGRGVVNIKRFRMAKLSRPLRRALLGLLEEMDAQALTEDMLRHRSYWVWAGEFLHPHEYARRFPQVASAFAVVRQFAPDGTRARPVRSYASRLEAAFARHDSDTLLTLLAERPGELGRRFDRTLRVVAADESAVSRLLEAFEASVRALSTPLLLGLQAYLPTRVAPAPVRMFWPKGAVARGVAAADTRPVLPGSAVARAVAALEQELLRRFGARPGVEDVLIDERLRDIPVPFNERTAARASVSLPRGSRLDVPTGQLARLFLHWCQPEGAEDDTDLDLSVAFYDSSWKYEGVCSYYQLRFPDSKPESIATSSGDLRDAPFPQGATEFVDVDQARARARGIRYAVMVVTAYAGLPFNELERAFAGLMFRDDPFNAQFDPRTVALKFALEGGNGVYLPLVLDLEARCLHWLDVYARGDFEFNNVEGSRKVINQICPQLMSYFGSGIRPSMYELSLLHAAARGQRVFLRGADGGLRRVERDGESAERFLARLRAGSGLPARPSEPGDGGRTLLAALYQGDLELPETSQRYCLIPQRTAGTLAAADLLS